MEGDGTVRVEEKARAVTISVPHGKPYAGKLHVRFDEGADVPDEGRSALLYSGRFRWEATFLYNGVYGNFAALRSL